jgi:hypothetical protein
MQTDQTHHRCFCYLGILGSTSNPNVAKVGGFQSQGVKAEAVLDLPRVLDNAGSEVLRLS